MNPSSPTFLIDAYNLLFFLFPHPKDLEKARKELILMLHSLSLRCQLIFDGAGDEVEIQSQKRLKIVYTPSRQKADQYIISTVKNDRHPERFITVSSDNEVKRRAKLFGSAILSIDEFLDKTLIREEKKRKEPSSFEETADNITRYQEIFAERYKELINKSQKN